MHAITAQIAVEAIVNAPEGFDYETMQAVLEDARKVGVADLYTDMLAEIIESAPDTSEITPWTGR